MKLVEYLSHPDRSLDPEVVGKADLCVLGKWIYGPGAGNSNIEEFRKLQEEHSEFHKCAAEVITRANSGDQSGAEAILKVNGPFALRSRTTIELIKAIQIKVTETR